MPFNLLPKHMLRSALLACLVAAPLAACDQPKSSSNAPAAGSDATKTASTTPAPAANPNDPVAATVNGQPIYQSQIDDLQREMGPRGAQVPRDKLIDNEVTRVLLSQAADAKKLGDDPGVQQEIARAKSRVLAQSYIFKVIKPGIPDDQIKAKYDEMVKQVPPQDEVRARHILVKSEAEAKDIIAQLNKGADFAKLADEKSTDTAATGGKGANGGDLGWFTKDKMVPAFSEAAFALKKGEYTKTPVKTQFGWHVILLEDRRPSAPPAYDEVKDQVATQLLRDAVTKNVGDLKNNAKIVEYNPDGTVMTPPPATPPAAAPGAAAPPAGTMSTAPAPTPATPPTPPAPPKP